MLIFIIWYKSTNFDSGLAFWCRYLTTKLDFVGDLKSKLTIICQNFKIRCQNLWLDVKNGWFDVIIYDLTSRSCVGQFFYLIHIFIFEFWLPLQVSFYTSIFLTPLYISSGILKNVLLNFRSIWLGLFFLIFYIKFFSFWLRALYNLPAEVWIF